MLFSDNETGGLDESPPDGRTRLSSIPWSPACSGDL